MELLRQPRKYTEGSNCRDAAPDRDSRVSCCSVPCVAELTQQLGVTRQPQNLARHRPAWRTPARPQLCPGHGGGAAHRALSLRLPPRPEGCRCPRPQIASLHPKHQGTEGCRLGALFGKGAVRMWGPVRIQGDVRRPSPRWLWVAAAGRAAPAVGCPENSRSALAVGALARVGLGALAEGLSRSHSRRTRAAWLGGWRGGVLETTHSPGCEQGRAGSSQRIGAGDPSVHARLLLEAWAPWHGGGS